MQGRTVLVTGGNSGIGKETAAELAALGASVIITARDTRRGEAAADEIRARRATQGDVRVLHLDLASLRSVHGFADELGASAPRLGVLVNNAGVFLTDRRVTEDGFETTFGVNHLGHFLLTNLLMERLRASAPARIVNVSSDAHTGAKRGLDFDDLQMERAYAGMQAYARSKLANILFTRELARRLQGTGVTANAVHPGGVRTGFGMDGDATGFWRIGLLIARPFMLSPARGARTSVYVASSPDVADVSGEYFFRRKPRRPTDWALDDEAARRLWEVSEGLVASG